MNKKRIFQVLAMALLTFTGAKAQSETMYIVQTVDGTTSVIEYPVSEIVSVVFDKSLIPYHSCPDDAHPHIIDLGLPSGTKWACCNVGASKPEDYGGRFNWGKTVDENNNECNLGYNVSILGDKSHDAATANWGDSWVTPTNEQLDELNSEDNCEWEWTTVNDIKGFKVKSKKEGYTDAYIFLPAAGYRNGSNVWDRGDNCFYWSSTPSGYWYAWNILANRDYRVVKDDERELGRSVRPVCQ